MILHHDARFNHTPAPAAIHDGHLKVFNHHVYEFRKGLRDLVLQTLPSRHAGWVARKLDTQGIDYFIVSAKQRNINVFFGHPDCLEIVRQLGIDDLSACSPEEDFILGILLGYGRRQQCRRYLNLKRQQCPPVDATATDAPPDRLTTDALRTGTPGFTLVELLVVIAIVAVLMAILMPALGRARAQAKQMVCQSQLRQLALAHVMYQQSHDQVVTPATQQRGVTEYWYNTLGPYFSRKSQGHGTRRDDLGQAILRCPEDRAAYPSLLNPHGDNPDGWLSYALNSQPTRYHSDRTRRYAGVGGNKITCIRRPAETLLHADVAFRAWICDAVTLTKNGYSSEPGAHYAAMPGYPAQNQAIEQAYRHHGRMTVLWADGHVGTLTQLPSAADNPTFWGPIYQNLSGQD